MPVRHGLLIVGALLLSACQHATKPTPRERFDAVPVAVEIPWLQFAPIPADFTGPLPIEQPASNACGEAVRVAYVRGKTIETANDHRARTRALSASGGASR